MENNSQRLIDALKASGMNQKKFAKALNISEGHLSEILRGKKQPSSSLSELAGIRFGRPSDATQSIIAGKGIQGHRAGNSPLNRDRGISEARFDKKLGVNDNSKLHGNLEEDAMLKEINRLQAKLIATQDSRIVALERENEELRQSLSEKQGRTGER